MNNKIVEYAKQLQNEIPGFIAFSITEIKSGKCVFNISASKNFDIEFISLCNVDFVKAKLNTIAAGELGDNLKNIIVNLEHQFHIIDVTKDNQFFFYVAVNNQEANLAIVLTKIIQMQKNDE